ncbi:hypothetical protein BW36_00688 [Micrococcus luteus]|nr:hypothetical protein BW36_00688 [Micrococcus luteus]
MPTEVHAVTTRAYAEAIQRAGSSAPHVQAKGEGDNAERRQHPRVPRGEAEDSGGRRRRGGRRGRGGHGHGGS